LALRKVPNIIATSALPTAFWIPFQNSHFHNLIPHQKVM
jgi:hypothetical protein